MGKAIIKEGFSSPSKIESFVLSEYGIKVNVVLFESKPIIKVYNHLSLFTIIKQIRRNFDFLVAHKKEENEYIITIGKFTPKES